MHEQQPHSEDTQAAAPPGRWARFQRRHPALYASRHVVLAVLKAAIPLLGLGTLITALLPWIDWAWLWELGASIRSWLPDNEPSFARRPDWLTHLLDSPLLDTFKWLVRQARWLVPIIIALLIAVEEVQRHKRKQEQEHSSDANAP